MNIGPIRGEPYIRAAVLFGFANLVRPNGGDPVALLERAGIPLEALSNPDMLISWRRHGVLMELAATELGMPALGLELARSIPPHFPNVGPIIFIAQIVDTGVEWIEHSMRYWRYHTDAYTLQLVDDANPDNVCFRFWQSPLVVAPRQQMELMLGNICNMARVITDLRHENPVLVRFQHPRPPDIGVHEELFRCDLQFDTEYNDIVFERRFLANQTSKRLKSLKALIDHFIRYRIKHMPLYDQTMRATVEVAIQSIMGTGSCSKEFIAASMGISPKKLQRLLAAEGTSFAEVLDGTRQLMARQMLSQTGVPISQIAGLLEYSSTTAFTLAFRRWTGTTPSAFRKQSEVEE